MKKGLLILSLLLITSSVYAEEPKALIEKITGRVISWGYVDFEPTSEQEVINGVYLDKDVDSGFKYDGTKIISAPEFKITPKTKKQEILDELGFTETDLDKLKTFLK